MGREIAVSNQLSINSEDLKDVRFIEKILHTLDKKFEHVVCAIEESNDIDDMAVNELMGSLQTHKHRMNQR